MQKKEKKTIISGTGCALGDYLFNQVAFDSKSFQKFISKKTGDGGISPGRLVFTEDVEKYANIAYPLILQEIIGDREHDAFNAGGPSIVSLIHVSQLIGSENIEVKFYGMAGKDETSDDILKIVQKTPLNIENYFISNKNSTPFTHVFSDPGYNNGMGERTFLNHLGAALDFSPDLIGDHFFRADITCFGGTALVPDIHANLTQLLLKAKESGCITVVNTVFDFKSEKNNPGKPWPLVRDEKSFELIDVLIMDCEEATRISGKSDIVSASEFFATTGVGAFFITNGEKDVYIYSGGGLFEQFSLKNMPVSEYAVETLLKEPERKGDTTGCGDNFAGGVIASLALQIKEKEKGSLDMVEALSWGVASGAFACFTLGGVYIEKHPGEKLEKVREIREKYLKQIGAKV